MSWYQRSTCSKYRSCLVALVHDSDEAAVEAVLPDHILGQPVSLELYRDPYTGRAYRRAIVTCGNPEHVDCKRRRNLNLTANLGSREVEAFLTCWLRYGVAGSGVSREEHRDYRPSLELQREFLHDIA